MKKRFGFAMLGCVLLMGVFANPGWTQEEKYPTRQIECIVNFPPGGPLDTSIRVIQPHLQAALGVPLVLTTKGGAAGALGTDFVAKAKPDGYTILASANAALTIAPNVNPQITYKYADFAHICTFTADPGVICSKTGAPWKNLEELVEYAKKNPGKLNYGSPGMGTVAYFAMEIFKMSYGLDIVPVHFQGTGPVKNAILGGHVDLSASGFGSLGPLIKGGNIFPLVTTAMKRVADFPDVPTMAEKGFPDASLNIWFGLFVPGKCPKNVVEKLSQAMEKVMKDPAVQSQIEKAAMIVDYRDSKATFQLVEQEFAAVAKVVKKMGLGK
jgi:tripartite-type tricarboxylate transporter receptor subunit TctC